MIDASWHVARNFVNEFELVLEDLNVPSSGFLFRTGYISRNFRDILYAVWYMSGYSCTPELTERQVKLLDDIKIVSQKRLAAFAAPQSAD